MKLSNHSDFVILTLAWALGAFGFFLSCVYAFLEYRINNNYTYAIILAVSLAIISYALYSMKTNAKKY